MDTISKQNKTKRKVRKDKTLGSMCINFSFRAHEGILTEENEGSVTLYKAKGD